MEVAIESKGNLERQMTVSLAPEEVDSKVDERLVELAKTIKVDGFRRNKKVSPRFMRQFYGQQAREQVVSELLNSRLQEALTEKSVNPIGEVNINITQNQAGASLDFQVDFEVSPAIDDIDPTGWVIEKPTVSITDVEIDKAIDRLRLFYAKWDAVDRETQNNDRLTLDYQVMVNDTVIEQATAKDVKLILGLKLILPEIEAALIGQSAGDIINLKVTFPKTHQLPELAGKESDVTITINLVEAPELPALDDAFCSTVGIKEGGVGALKTWIKHDLERQVSDATQELLKRDIFDKLLSQNKKNELPKKLVAAEERLIASQKQYAQAQAAETEPHEQNQKNNKGQSKKKDKSAKQDTADLARFITADVHEQAERAVNLKLIVRHAITQFELKLDEKLYTDYARNIIAQHEDPNWVTQQIMNQNSALSENIRAAVIERQLIDKLLELAEVNEIASSFDDVVKTQVM